MFFKSEKNIPKNKPRKGGSRGGGIITCPKCCVAAKEIPEKLHKEKDGFVGFYICQWCYYPSKIYKKSDTYETFMTSKSLSTKVHRELREEYCIEETQTEKFQKGDLVTAVTGNGEVLEGVFYEDAGWTHWIQLARYNGVKVACKPKLTRRRK